MADATIAARYISNPHATWTGTEKIPLDNAGTGEVGLASTLKTYVVGAGAVSVASGKTLTVSNTLTFTGTDSSSVAFGAGGTVLYNAGALGTPASGTLTNATGLPAAGVVGTAAILGANTFTALQTITQASSNAGYFAATGLSLTGSNATNMIDLAGTLNTSGSPIAIKIALTNTASGASTKFLSFLSGAGGATEAFSVDKIGTTSWYGTASAGDFVRIFGSGGVPGLYFNTNATGTIVRIADSGSSNAAQLNFGALGAVTWQSTNRQDSGSQDLLLTRRAAATLQHGAADAASPVAQTIATQGARAGTDSNVGGAALTIQSGLGTGTGTPSNLVLNGIVGTTTGTGTQAASAAITIAGVATGQLPSIVLGSAALATNATGGFLYIPTCAGTPSGTPTANTGRVALIYDTTAHQFWIYDGAWLQPKTPAAAAIVTWQ